MIKRILDQWTADQEQKRRWREEDRAERKAAERAAAEKAAAEADAKALTDAMVKAETEAKAREAADAQAAKEAKDEEVMQAVVRDLVNTKHMAATLSTLRITCHQDTADSLARIAFDSASWTDPAHPWHGRVTFNDDDTVTVAISSVHLVQVLEALFNTGNPWTSRKSTDARLAWPLYLFLGEQVRRVAQGAEGGEMPSGAARVDDDALRDATEGPQ
ncbi:hypothetical protein [Streptomyces sp. KS 21]|uniref:hypothetical protein n=1 Tax=Streptomyces sp. KS 21 TaxID=2485150 RepID=UPI0010EACF60|nr:hypothetical protein [Streptomyces sp. KS 21]TDU67974.1 hypothetical protein EDD91_8036 [Streptomyces sp. KS 21]